MVIDLGGLMITGVQARKLLDANLTFVSRRQIYELSSIHMQMVSRLATNQNFLVYTVYRNSLTLNEFSTLLKAIKEKVVGQGHNVDRIIDPSNDIYIFRINWEDDDVLAGVDVPLSVGV